MRVVEDLPHGFIVGANYFRRTGSAVAFTSDKGFTSVPSATWAPFRTAILDTPRQRTPPPGHGIGFVC